MSCGFSLGSSVWTGLTEDACGEVGWWMRGWVVAVDGGRERWSWPLEEGRKRLDIIKDILCTFCSWSAEPFGENNTMRAIPEGKRRDEMLALCAGWGRRHRSCFLESFQRRRRCVWWELGVKKAGNLFLRVWNLPSHTRITTEHNRIDMLSISRDLSMGIFFAKFCKSVNSRLFYDFFLCGEDCCDLN
jgi:hypothetical protein